VRKSTGFAILILIAALYAQPALAVATITVVNTDGAGEGFNDPTPFTPSGGNPATTLGQARLIAFQHAAFLWGSMLTSHVEIKIGAAMNPLAGNATSAVLGQAGSSTVHRNFLNAPVAATWYPQALANSLSGADQDPGTPDINATFNSNVDNAVVLGSTDWYYGVDGNPGSDIDFVSVVLHELGHGLGFQTFADLTTGAKLSGFDDTFLRNLECHGAAPTSYGASSNAQRIPCNISDPNLHWLGANVITAATGVLTAGFPGSHVQMNAPSPLQLGSSVSHFSIAAFPNQLMEPSYTGANHSVALALPLMKDIGWNVQALNGTDVVFVMDTTGSTGELLPDWVLQIPIIAQAWKNFDPNARFALVSHVDFPFSPHGSAGEWAYRVETTLNGNTSNLTAALALLTQQGGGDTGESQYEAIYQVLTGSGRDLTAPVNYTGTGEIPPVSLNRLYPMVIYHFTYPEVFHDRDVEPDYPFVGSGPVAGRTAVLAELAVQSANNMFFGLTFNPNPLFTVNGENGQTPPTFVPSSAGKPQSLEITTGPLYEMAALTGGAVYNVGNNDLSQLQAAITASIVRWSKSAQKGDLDLDGVTDAADNCSLASNPNQLDSDGDKVGNACDNCALIANADQRDTDLDGIGDACETAVACTPSDTTLCLNQDRFKVETDWRKGDGTTGVGHGVELTGDTGYFWFFNNANVEVVTKVLDGCGVNSRYWVFGAGLTDVQVTMRITDTKSGATRTYINPQGTAFVALQDTGAFATCP
jgi:hypothetical protein